MNNKRPSASQRAERRDRMNIILDDMCMITTQMFSGLTVPQFNVWVLIVCTIAGSILSAVTIRR